MLNYSDPDRSWAHSSIFLQTGTDSILTASFCELFSHIKAHLHHMSSSSGSFLASVCAGAVPEWITCSHAAFVVCKVEWYSEGLTVWPCEMYDVWLFGCIIDARSLACGGWEEESRSRPRGLSVRLVHYCIMVVILSASFMRRFYSRCEADVPILENCLLFMHFLFFALPDLIHPIIYCIMLHFTIGYLRAGGGDRAYMQMVVQPSLSPAGRQS